MAVTLQQMYYEGIQLLKAVGIDNASYEVKLLIESLFNISTVELLTHKEKKLSENDYRRFKRCIERRRKKEPLQYIIGEQEFMGLTFKVTPHVLIPRQDTELLVETVIPYCREDMDVLDMCTGSGCIAISLAYYTQLNTLWAIDISKEALKVARINSEALIDKKIQWIESDLFSAIHPSKRWDIIVSNPPYIPSQTIEGLMTEVKDYEPRLALDGEEDGLFFYREITKGAKTYLKQKGMLFFEIGYDQGEAVKNILAIEGFKEIQLLKDLSGLDRVIYGTLA